MNKKVIKQRFRDSNSIGKGVGQITVTNKIQISDLLGLGKIAEEIRKFIAQ